MAARADSASRAGAPRRATATTSAAVRPAPRTTISVASVPVARPGSIRPQVTAAAGCPPLPPGGRPAQRGCVRQAPRRGYRRGVDAAHVMVNEAKTDSEAMYACPVEGCGRRLVINWFRPRSRSSTRATSGPVTSGCPTGSAWRPPSSRPRWRRVLSGAVRGAWLADARLAPFGGPGHPSRSVAVADRTRRRRRSCGPARATKASTSARRDVRATGAGRHRELRSVRRGSPP